MKSFLAFSFAQKKRLVNCVFECKDEEVEILTNKVATTGPDSDDTKNDLENNKFHSEKVIIIIIILFFPVF